MTGTVSNLCPPSAWLATSINKQLLNEPVINPTVVNKHLDESGTVLCAVGDSGEEKHGPGSAVYTLCGLGQRTTPLSLRVLICEME